MAITKTGGVWQGYKALAEHIPQAYKFIKPHSKKIMDTIRAMPSTTLAFAGQTAATMPPAQGKRYIDNIVKAVAATMGMGVAGLAAGSGVAGYKLRGFMDKRRKAKENK